MRLTDQSLSQNRAAYWRWTGTVHLDTVSGLRLGGSPEYDDAGYDDPPDDLDGSRCRRTPPDGAVKLMPRRNRRPWLGQMRG
jgi:hypothetical protein